MFIQRITYTAGIGKGPQLRALLEERVQERQSQGTRIALSRLIAGDGFQLVAAIAHETLADFQANLERVQEDPSLQSWQDRIAPLLGERSQTVLLEQIIEAPPTSPPARFAQRVILTPAVGKVPELQQVLTERIQSSPRPGVSLGLAMTAYGGPLAFQVRLVAPDLAAIDAMREANRADPTWQPYLDRVLSLCSENPELNLTQIIIPMQPAEQRELAGAATR